VGVITYQTFYVYTVEFCIKNTGHCTRISALVITCVFKLLYFIMSWMGSKHLGT